MEKGRGKGEAMTSGGDVEDELRANLKLRRELVAEVCWGV